MSKENMSKRDVLTSIFMCGGIYWTNSMGNNRLSQTLSAKEEAVVIGSLLGDGFMQISPNRKKARLRWTHGVKQKDYVDWQHKQLINLCKTVKAPEKSEHEYIAYSSYLSSLQVYHQWMYKPTEHGNYRKIIPPDLKLYLKDPLSLLVWYLDDGTLRRDCYSCRFGTQCFNEEEHLILKNCLWENFHIGSVIQHHKKKAGQYTLSLPARGRHCHNFLSLFKDIVIEEIPSMKYKVLFEKNSRPRND